MVDCRGEIWFEEVPLSNVNHQGLHWRVNGMFTKFVDAEPKVMSEARFQFYLCGWIDSCSRQPSPPEELGVSCQIHTKRIQGFHPSRAEIEQVVSVSQTQGVVPVVSGRKSKKCTAHERIPQGCL